MSRKPESVRKNAEAANAAITELGNTATGDDKPIDAAASPADKATPPVETPVTASTSDTTITEGNPLDKPLGNETDPWEQRYKILQGKYNKEVPELHNQIRQLKDRPSEPGNNQDIERLRKENADLKQQLESAAPKQIEVNADLDSLREQYPAELVDGILAVVKGMVAPLQQRVDSVDQTVSQNNKSGNVERLRSLLKQKGIDFDQLNNDPVFVQDFLGEPDRYSKRSKGQLLTEAFESGDVSRAAQFFIDYSGAQESASSAGNSKAGIGKHVQVQSGAAGDNTSTMQNVWTEQAITQFYEDKRRGKYSPEQARALEADLFASMNRS